MTQRLNWKWNPTAAQKELFEEWEKFTIGYLVSSREGVNVRSIPSCLQENTGEDIPLEKMGFRTINQFVYQMQDSIEVRKLNEKLFIFIRECAVPSAMMDLRKLVLGQAKDKGCKTKTGIIKRPTKTQSSYVRTEELLLAVQHIINRPNFTNYRPTGFSSTTAPPARRPGVPLNTRPNSNSRPTSVNRVPRNMPTRYSRNSTSYSTGVSKPSFQPQKPTTSATVRPSYCLNGGKENYSRPTATVLQNDWCDNASKGSAAASREYGNNSHHQSGRVPRIPQGLILSDSGTDDDSDMDGFDYCGGPVKASIIKIQEDKQVPKTTQATVSNATTTNSHVSGSLRPTTVPQKGLAAVSNSSITNTTKPMVSTVATSSILNKSISLNTSNTPGNISKNSTITLSAQTTQTVNPKPYNGSVVPQSVEPTPTPKPVAHLLKSVDRTPLPKPTATSFARQSLESTKSIQENGVGTTINDKVVTTFRKEKMRMMPSVGHTLDTDNPLINELKEPAVRMVLSLSKIRFPQFLRGGSLQANVGLKAYLASIP